MRIYRIFFLVVSSLMGFGMADELKLPALLKASNGEQIKTSEQWENVRRPEILRLFKDEVFGNNPVGRPDDLRFEIIETDENAMSGAATLRRVHIHFSGNGGKGVIHLSLFIPNKATRPVPGFLLLCNRVKTNIDPTRKIKSPYWPAERIVERGYAAATYHISDADPDRFDGFKNGVHGIFDEKLAKGGERSKRAWGTIAAWAWGASRVMDYFESDTMIDEKRIGVVGHSRGGKTALWCGASDERFALTVSNNSGCGGAGLSRNKESRRVKGKRRAERIADLNRVFPHWFCGNYIKYSNKEADLPVDQHSLLALIAPRLVYVSSATLDYWADPQGEFLSCVHSAPVFQLYGHQGVGAIVMPKPEVPLNTGHIGYHLRTGKHNLVEYDWNRFMDFTDSHWKKSNIIKSR